MSILPYSNITYLKKITHLNKVVLVIKGKKTGLTEYPDRIFFVKPAVKILLFKIQGRELGQPALVELFVEFSFVAAVGGVFLENVAFAPSEFFQD